MEQSRTVLVTGGNRGIGFAIAEEFIDGGGDQQQPRAARASHAPVVDPGLVEVRCPAPHQMVEVADHDVPGLQAHQVHAGLLGRSPYQRTVEGHDPRVAERAFFAGVFVPVGLVQAHQGIEEGQPLVGAHRDRAGQRSARIHEPARGAAQVVCEIDGQPWRQDPFVYQAKCLKWLREAYSALTPADQGRVDAILAGTGCEALFERA